ncbi:MAG: capsule assembly Wzi family protein [Treponema sp.]|jgi:hypothetical protein|nr:capsule assembly Wzi family protein [Treponema sp.]
MKKCAAAVLLGLLGLTGLNAQVIHDPNDALYRDIDRWSVRGYISSSLPLIRPYPAQLIDDLLTQAIENGNGEAREKAAYYKRAIAPGSRPIHPGITGSIEGLDGDLTALGSASLDGVVRVSDWIGTSYSMFLYASTKTPGNEYNVPGTYSPFPDLVEDTADIGPFKMMQDWTSALGIGKPDFYFQSGLNRTSIGPFYDNGVVAGPQAARAGHFSLNYRRPKWSFEMLMLALSASDDFGQKAFPEKYLMFHSFNFNPWPNFEFGFLESVVWGGRLEALYLVPFTNLFGAQAMSGDFADNSFLGFHIRWNAFRNMQFATQFYVDDFHVNDVMRLKFNTKYKLAAEAGLVWAPDAGLLSNLAADYTMVFPYMYTHWNTPDEDRYAGGPNYLNYSHMGRNLGTDLEPNSDRISVRTSWRTLPNLDLSLGAYFTRHANASDNILPGGYDPDDDSPDDNDKYHDGTIFDDGDAKDGNNYSYLRFLIQDNIDTRLAGSLGVKWTLPTVAGAFSLNADYVLEYGWNRNLEKSNNGLTSYWSVGGSWHW